MTYRKEILEAVEEAFDYVRDDYLGVPLANEAEWEALKQEAVSLLKEQEPVKPMLSQDEVGPVYRCGHCNAVIYCISQYSPADEACRHAKYCHNCGQEVKWDD